MDIRRIAYEKHRLRWMLDHGKTITDLINELNTMQQECPDINSINDLFEDWELDCGFGSECWPCLGEFSQTEFKDEHYMHSLLTAEEWDAYTKIRVFF